MRTSPKWLKLFNACRAAGFVKTNQTSCWLLPVFDEVARQRLSPPVVIGLHVNLATTGLASSTQGQSNPVVVPERAVLDQRHPASAA